jgi:hypothetical protein
MMRMTIEIAISTVVAPVHRFVLLFDETCMSFNPYSVNTVGNIRTISKRTVFRLAPVEAWKC